MIIAASGIDIQIYLTANL